MEGLRVTKLARDPRGFWTANVSLNGKTLRVDNSSGAWVAPEGKGCALDARRGWHVLPDVARVLQQKVRRLERQESKGPREPRADATVEPQTE